MSTDTGLSDEEQDLEAAADAALGGELLSTLDAVDPGKTKR